MSASVSEIHHHPEKPNWLTIVVFSLFHIGAVAALFNFTWTRFWVAFAIYWVAISWGIGMGYHRLLTHRGYKCPQWFERFLAICGALSLEGGPIFWVATHRVHHQKSDQPGDPHSPRDGAWWAHLWWMCVGEPKHSDTKGLSKYAPDLARDPFMVWLNDYHWVPLTSLGIVLLALGGWQMVLWGVCLRVTLGLHATWLVNSATHLWGSQRFDAGDDSRNNWWVALLTFGEGWHNNHHAHPVSARHGLAWYELDMTYWQLKALEVIGVISNVKVASVDGYIPVRKAA
jgi:stearoyl-CoA desaturase (delta-9 desaturase)